MIVWAQGRVNAWSLFHKGLYVPSSRGGGTQLTVAVTTLITHEFPERLSCQIKDSEIDRRENEMAILLR